MNVGGAWNATAEVKNVAIRASEKRNRGVIVSVGLFVVDTIV